MRFKASGRVQLHKLGIRKRALMIGSISWVLGREQQAYSNISVALTSFFALSSSSYGVAFYSVFILYFEYNSGRLSSIVITCYGVLDSITNKPD